MKFIKKLNNNKPVTEAQFYAYKSHILKRAIMRTNKFNDLGHNYYWIKLAELEQIEENYNKTKDLKE